MYDTVAGHARLSWYTSGDEDNFSAGESLFQAIGVRLIARDNALGVDVSNVSGNACSRVQLSCLKMSMLSLTWSAFDVV